MRTGKELIKASLPFAKEKKSTSWFYTISTIALVSLAIAGTFNPFHWSLQLLSSLLSSLLIVKFFILYHDYNHHAILKNSTVGKIIMFTYGIIFLAPITIWKRTHDFHHFNNAKLSNSGIGAFPLLERQDFNALSKKDKFMYLAARHPLTIFFGYITLFFLDLNVKSIILSPIKHWDSILAVVVHIYLGYLLFSYGGVKAFALTMFIPYLISNCLGAYLFYVQHNFPSAIYVKNKDWNYTHAATKSTSFLKMGAIMNWVTGDIGYHHVHHLNHHIPFYRLREAMAAIPEMQTPLTITLSPKDIIASLRLKVWDDKNGRMEAV